MKWQFELELDQVRRYVDFWKVGLSQELGLGQDTIKDIFKPDIAFAKALEAQLPPDSPKAGEIWEHRFGLADSERGRRFITGPTWNEHISIVELDAHPGRGPYFIPLRVFLREHVRATDTTAQKMPKPGDIWCSNDGLEHLIFIEKMNGNGDFVEIKEAHTPTNWTIGGDSFITLKSVILSDYRFVCNPKEDMEKANQEELASLPNYGDDNFIPYEGFNS